MTEHRITLTEWLDEQERRTAGYQADTPSGRLRTALQIIRAAIDANTPEEVVELAEQIINEGKP